MAKLRLIKTGKSHEMNKTYCAVDGANHIFKLKERKRTAKRKKGGYTDWREYVLLKKIT